MGGSPAPLAFSPGSITCFFYVHRGTSPRSTFSRGCAINISEGVHATVTESDHSGVFLNGKPIELPPVQAIVAQLAPRAVSVYLESPLPIGCGFGLSASGTLAAGFALNHFFDLGQSRERLGMMAHVAEVESGTGVGDVAAQLCGGIVYRRCRNDPFDCRRLEISNPSLRYCVFGPLSTSDVLRSTDVVAAIAREGPLACRWLEAEGNPSLEEILRRSREFTEASGLLTPQLRDTIDGVVGEGDQASMILLGQSIIATGAGDPSIWTATAVDRLGTRVLH